MAVRVGSILERKGSEVYTVRPDAVVRDVVEQLREHNIGALVVTGEDEAVAGIVSERDIVRHLATDGASCLDRNVADIMTTTVITCAREQTADDLRAIMVERRIRHVPVVEDARLIGLVSIGDITKSSIDELEVKAEALEEYITGSAY